MFQKHVFISRLFSSVVLWSLALWTIFSGYQPGFFVLITGMSMLGLWEFYTILDKKKLPNFKMFGMACGFLLSAGTFWYLSHSASAAGGFPAALYDFETATLVTFMLVIFSRQLFQVSRDKLPLETMAYTAFGLFYVPWLFSFMMKLVYLPPRDELGHVTGQWYVLYLCVVTKFSDMGAYVTGSLIGKHLMIPHISPKKTWEGFFGALAFSVGGSFAVRALASHNLHALSSTDALVLGLGLGFAAIIGDLAESVVKRSTDAKDSGHLLPGIGGALDLIDSILFTAPLLFFYLRFNVGMK
jgi:phosphatidate cytidylyltransferase